MVSRYISILFFIQGITYVIKKLTCKFKYKGSNDDILPPCTTNIDHLIRNQQIRSTASAQLIAQNGQMLMTTTQRVLRMCMNNLHYNVNSTRALIGLCLLVTSH